MGRSIGKLAAACVGAGLVGSCSNIQWQPYAGPTGPNAALLNVTDTDKDPLDVYTFKSPEDCRFRIGLQNAIITGDLAVTQSFQKIDADKPISIGVIARLPAPIDSLIPSTPRSYNHTCEWYLNFVPKADRYYRIAVSHNEDKGRCFATLTSSTTADFANATTETYRAMWATELPLNNDSSFCSTDPDAGTDHALTQIGWPAT